MLPWEAPAYGVPTGGKHLAAGGVTSVGAPRVIGRGSERRGARPAFTAPALRQAVLFQCSAFGRPTRACPARSAQPSVVALLHVRRYAFAVIDGLCHARTPPQPQWGLRRAHRRKRRPRGVTAHHSRRRRDAGEAEARPAVTAAPGAVGDENKLEATCTAKP